jgi:glycosyltransferase involved in cell wall biosynthesis
MTRPPTVLHLLNATEAGGLSRYVIDLARATRDAGWRVVVAGDRGAWHDRFADVEFIELPITRGPLGFLRSVGAMRRWLASNPVDLIHTHYRKATWLARLLQRRGSPPVLYTLHLSHLNVCGWRRWLTDFGDVTHVASEDARQWIVDVARVDPAKVTLIPHGIDVNKWPVTTPADRAAARRELNLRDSDVVALFVGRMDRQKQPSWILAAASAISLNEPDRARETHWLLVGDGPELLPEQQSKQSYIEEGILPNGVMHFLGERDPLVPYRAADLLVSPSWREGFGYTPAEALSTGLPVLRTRTSGTCETIVEGVTGRSVPILYRAFETAAREMLAAPEKLAAMRPACAAHARAHLRFDVQVARTLALYRSIARLDA